MPDKDQVFSGPSVPVTHSFEEGRLEHSQKSTSLEEESAFSELYDNLVGHMDRQRDVLGLMKRKYEVAFLYHL